MIPAMTSPIDPIRRAAQLRRARKTRADDADAASGAEGANLPALIEAPPAPAQPAPTPGVEAAFAAQLIGQDGQRRGLRGGPGVIDTANTSYNKVEWSGARDRRARTGRITKTEI